MKLPTSLAFFNREFWQVTIGDLRQPQMTFLRVTDQLCTWIINNGAYNAIQVHCADLTRTGGNWFSPIVLKWAINKMDLNSGQQCRDNIFRKCVEGMADKE